MTLLPRFVREGRGLSIFAAGTLAFMVLVILWGSVVRATGSGAGCGVHWPLCNGEFVPHHPRLATIIEFVHRSTSGILVGLYAVLAAWTFLARPKGSLVRKAVVWSGVLIVTEALLGALLVLRSYVEANASNARVLAQGVHLTNTMLLVGALTLTWWWSRPREASSSLVTALPLLVWTAVIATIVVAATGSIAALADTLFPAHSLREGLMADFAANAPLIVRMRWLHPVASMVSVAASGWLAWRLRSGRGRVLLGLIALQLALGIGDVLLLAPTWLQVLHLLGADLFWIALVTTGADILLPRAKESRHAARSYEAADSLHPVTRPT